MCASTWDFMPVLGTLFLHEIQVISSKGAAFAAPGADERGATGLPAPPTPVPAVVVTPLPADEGGV